MQTTTPKQHYREKAEARAMDALREQMAAIAKSSEGKKQSTEIETYKSIRESLSPATLNVLIEMKHAGSSGATTKGLSIITRYSEITVKKSIARLAHMGAAELTGFAHDRPRHRRVTREGVNIIQASS